jgi:dTDP-glucose 4,6-dehydratase
MRIVVTGGAGFIGSHLCEALLNRGDEVICVDNLVTGSLSNIEHLNGFTGLSFVEQNVSDQLDIDGPVDYILHFASPASPIDFGILAVEILRVGSVGTHNCLELARRKGASFLIASTSETYGDPLVHPQPETYWGNVNPIGIRGCYDESKRFGEAMTMAYYRTHDLDTHILRIFNTYGSRMRPGDGRVIPAFFMQALQDAPITVFGDGSQTRSFQYINDLIRGILLLMESDEHLPVNIGNSTESTVLELAGAVIELTGSSSKIVNRPLPPDDPKIRRPDITKAREILGWEPRVGLQEGLRLTVDWFKSQVADGNGV